MYHKTLSALVILLLCSFRLSEPDTFPKLLDKAKMSFTLPEGFHEVPAVKNIQMNYEFAMQDSAGDLEVRYTIRPIDTVKQKQTHMNFDNELTNFTIFNTILFNISDQKLKMPDIMRHVKKMPQNAVTQLFNADHVMGSMVNLGKEFGQDYKYSFILNVHKKATANAFIYLMAKDSSTLKHITRPVLSALRFK